MPLPRPRLYVGLVTADPDRLCAFYGQVLGLPEAEPLAPPGVGRMRRFIQGDSTLKILEPFDPPAPLAPAPFTAATGIRYLTLTVDDLDAALSRCAEAGAPLRIAPVDVRPGVRAAIVEDPDGNAVELMQVD